MAVLQKIRQRSALLIVVIGFCLFAFIAGDVFTKGSFGKSSNDVGSVNGKDIPFEDFRLKVSNFEKSQQGISNTAASNRVWDQEVSIALLTAEFDKLGLRVSAKNIMEILKADQNIGQNPMFLNAAGTFDEAKFKEAIKTKPEIAQYIKDREKDATLNAKYQMYSSMVKAASFTTDAEGKLKYEMESNKVNFSYVAGLYSSIKDTDVKVTDEEIVAFMQKNEKKYKSEESREIEYVLIEDKASAQDEADVKAKINGLLSGSVVYNNQTGKNDTIKGFKFANNTAEFVNANSDVPYDSTYVAKKDLPAVEADKLYNLAPGEIYGPYLNGKFYCISKSLGRKSGVIAKANHILISYEGTQVPNKREKRTKEEAKAKAENLLAQAKANPDNFFMMAYTSSDDSSAQQGGDLGYFGPGQMVKPFNDFVFNSAVGVIGLVETDFGFHIIKVADKQDGVRLATISQKLQASEATSDKIFAQATQFEIDANEKDFAKAATALKLTVAPPVTLKAVEEAVGTLGNQRNIVLWSFADDSKVGTVKRFEVANLGNVIAKVKKITPKGLMAVDLVRASIEPILRNKKKAEMLKAKMTGATLEAIAKSVAAPVQQAMDLTAENTMIAAVGNEPKVVGNAFALTAGKLSATIEGNSGVFVVKNNSTTKAPAIKDYTAYVAKLKSQSAGDANRVLPALKDKAEIVDNRLQFNY